MPVCGPVTHLTTMEMGCSDLPSEKNFPVSYRKSTLSSQATSHEPSRPLHSWSPSQGPSVAGVPRPASRLQSGTPPHPRPAPTRILGSRAENFSDLQDSPGSSCPVLLSPSFTLHIHYPLLNS